MPPGPGPADVRLTVEVGWSKHTVQARAPKGQPPTQQIRAVLPLLERGLLEQLDRADARATKSAPELAEQLEGDNRIPTEGTI